MQLAARWAGGPAALVLITPPKGVRALLRASPVSAPSSAVLRSPLDLLRSARQLRCPVLMLLSEHDNRVPHAHSLNLAAALREASAQVEVPTLAGTTHRSLARAPAAMARLGQALCTSAASSRGLCVVSPA